MSEDVFKSTSVKAYYAYSVDSVFKMQLVL